MYALYWSTLAKPISVSKYENGNVVARRILYYPGDVKFLAKTHCGSSKRTVELKGYPLPTGPSIYYLGKAGPKLFKCSIKTFRIDGWCHFCDGCVIHRLRWILLAHLSRLHPVHGLFREDLVVHTTESRSADCSPYMMEWEGCSASQMFSVLVQLQDFHVCINKHFIYKKEQALQLFSGWILCVLPREYHNEGGKTSKVKSHESRLMCQNCCLI